MGIDYNRYLKLTEKTYYKRLGKVVKIVGLTIESLGPEAKLNDLCHIIIDQETGKRVLAEVVGFKDKSLLLMPYDSVEGVGLGCIVENTNKPLSIPVSNKMLGHVLDGVGRCEDMGDTTLWEEYPVEEMPPDPMKRAIISEVLPLGVKAVDGLITVGKGQRMEYLRDPALVSQPYWVCLQEILQRISMLSPLSESEAGRSGSS